MNDFGIKVVKEGKDISSTDIRDWILHSNNSMFKYNGTLSGDITINVGQDSGSLELTHNLGYIPAFLVYQDGYLFPQEVKAYATSSKIYISRNLSAPLGQTTKTYYAEEQYSEDTFSGLYIIAGDKFGNNDGSAVRFIDVDVPQGTNITQALFDWETVITTADENILFKMYGIDEDNTDTFGNPMGRPKTDAVRTKIQAPSGTFNYGDDITTLIQEILNRPGWSSGNAMGFLFNDNGTADNHFLCTNSTTFNVDQIYIRITYNEGSSETTHYKVVVFKDKIA